jgi:hypothetical protein
MTRGNYCAHWWREPKPINTLASGFHWDQNQEEKSALASSVDRNLWLFPVRWSNLS